MLRIAFDQVNLIKGDTLWQLEAVHFCLDEASLVVAAPSSPDHSPEASGGAQDVVAGIGTGRILFPSSAIVSGRDDRDGFSGGDCRVAGPCVTGAVRCPATVCVQTVRGGTDLADGLVIGDLLQQPGQHGGIAHSRPGHFDGADFQRFRVNSKVNLAPLPWL